MTGEGWAALGEHLIEAAPVVVGLLDREAFCYRFLSPYVSTVLGYTPEELVAAGSDIFGGILDPQGKANWQAHFEVIDEGEDSQIVEILLEARHKQGRTCWLLCRDRAFRRRDDGRATAILSMAMDVTLLMESRRKIIESRNRAQAASRAKDEFMTLISHELHTPLNAVFGGAQLLQQGSMDPEQAESCQMVLEGAHALRRLFADLLEYSQAQAETGGGGNEEIRFAEELEMIDASGREQAQENGLSWQTELAADLPAVVWGDRVRFLAILRHLVENAVKFTEEGGVSLSLRISHRSPPDIFIEIAVRDTGVGISPDVHDRIFDPFQQGEATGTRRFAGTGIGLTIAQRHAAVMGGRIEVESQTGKGSCFRVVLPFRTEPF